MLEVVDWDFVFGEVVSIDGYFRVYLISVNRFSRVCVSHLIYRESRSHYSVLINIFGLLNAWLAST